MERISREMVKRACGLGGLGFPDLVKFVDMHFWLVALRTMSLDGRTADMMGYMGGWLFRRWKWKKVELKKPVSYFISVHYKRLDDIRTKYGLEVLGVEGNVKAKVKKEMYKNYCV